MEKVRLMSTKDLFALFVCNSKGVSPLTAVELESLQQNSLEPHSCEEEAAVYYQQELNKHFVRLKNKYPDDTIKICELAGHSYMRSSASNIWVRTTWACDLDPSMVSSDMVQPHNHKLHQPWDAYVGHRGTVVATKINSLIFVALCMHGLIKDENERKFNLAIHETHSKHAVIKFTDNNTVPLASSVAPTASFANDVEADRIPLNASAINIGDQLVAMPSEDLVQISFGTGNRKSKNGLYKPPPFVYDLALATSTIILDMWIQRMAKPGTEFMEGAECCQAFIQACNEKKFHIFHMPNWINRLLAGSTSTTFKVVVVKRDHIIALVFLLPSSCLLSRGPAPFYNLDSVKVARLNAVNIFRKLMGLALLDIEGDPWGSDKHPLDVSILDMPFKSQSQVGGEWSPNESALEAYDKQATKIGCMQPFNVWLETQISVVQHKLEDIPWFFLNKLGYSRTGLTSPDDAAKKYYQNLVDTKMLAEDANFDSWYKQDLKKNLKILHDCPSFARSILGSRRNPYDAEHTWQSQKSLILLCKEKGVSYQLNKSGDKGRSKVLKQRLLNDELRKTTDFTRDILVASYNKEILVLMCKDRDLAIYVGDKREKMTKAELINQVVQHQSDLLEFEAPDQCDNPLKRQRLGK